MLRNFFGYENVIKVPQKWSLKVYEKSDIDNLEIFLRIWKLVCKCIGLKIIYRGFKKYCPWSKVIVENKFQK
jgi:hypothetical protein